MTSGVRMRQSGRAWSRVLAGLMACAFLVAGCVRTPPEERLREAVGDLQAAIGERNVSALNDMLT